MGQRRHLPGIALVAFTIRQHHQHVGVPVTVGLLRLQLGRRLGGGLLLVISGLARLQAEDVAYGRVDRITQIRAALIDAVEGDIGQRREKM